MHYFVELHRRCLPGLSQTGYRISESEVLPVVTVNKHHDHHDGIRRQRRTVTVTRRRTRWQATVALTVLLCFINTDAVTLRVLRCFINTDEGGI